MGVIRPPASSAPGIIGEWLQTEARYLVTNVTARRFPPPWSVEQQAACFVVRDGNRQQLAYVYFEEEPGRRSGPQPHFNILRPQISMPTPHLSNMPPLHLSNSKPRGKPVEAEDQVLHGGAGQPVTQQQSTTGTTSGNLVSNVSGGAAPSRFRVIEVTRGRFAVVEGRSENIVAAGFENSKAAWAWIANHI